MVKDTNYETPCYVMFSLLQLLLLCYPQHPALKHNLCSFLRIRDIVIHSHKTKGKVILIYL
jgi:hypothetical protein